MKTKLKTIEVRGGSSGRLVINACDYDPKKYDLWVSEELPGLNPNDEVMSSDLSAQDVARGSNTIFSATDTYAELKEKAALFGISAKGKDALIKKLKDAGRMT